MNRFSLFSTLSVLSVAVLAALLTPTCTQMPAAAPPHTAHVFSELVDPVDNPRLQKLIAQYDQYFAGQMAATGTPGAAMVIVKDSQVVFERGYGLRAVGTPDSVDVNTVFRIGSLSKGFAGVLSGILVSQGTLAWDEPVQQLVPEFKLRDREQTGRIQLWHLLSHTTGLPYHAYTHLIEQGYDIPALMKYRFPTVPLAWKEGSTYSYQNAVFCVVEEMMKAATGETYQTLLNEKIFRPAHMRTASCDYASICSALDKALPHYPAKGGTWRPDVITEHYYNATAAGGVNASITDMGEWLKVLLGYRPDVVSAATLDKVFSPVVKTGRERQIFPQWISKDEASYALGWRVLEHNGDTILYHSGSVNGFRAEIALNRRDGIAVCMLFNACTPLGKDCVPAFFERWNDSRVAVLGWQP